MDMIFTSMTFHHFTDRALVASECLRVLRPGGALLVSSPSQYWRFPYYRALARWCPSEDEILALCRVVREHPGTTLEFIPGVWLFGTNDDFVGQTLETDPMFQVDGHLTRDLTERIWASLDGAWYTGGQATIDGVQGEKLNNLGIGVTLGYQINDNLGLTVGYKSTVNDKAPGDLQMDGFMVSLVAGWHPLVEGARRLKGD